MDRNRHPVLTPRRDVLWLIVGEPMTPSKSETPIPLLDQLLSEMEEYAKYGSVTDHRRIWHWASALRASLRCLREQPSNAALTHRLETAITIATNEAIGMDTSGIKSELARFAFQKISEQWAYVRDVLIELRGEPDNRAWIDKEPAVAALMAVAANASGVLEKSHPELSGRLWTAIQRLTLPSGSAAESEKEWRCFHCDEVFTDEAEAREHFGVEIQPFMGEGAHMPPPACAVDVKAFRDLETDNHRLSVENRGLENDARLWHEAEADRVRRIGNREWWQELDSRDGERLVLIERVKELEAVVTSQPSPSAGSAPAKDERLRELAERLQSSVHWNWINGYENGEYSNADGHMSLLPCPHPDCVLVRSAGSAGGPEPATTCESDCNPYLARCGARFCSYEAMAIHERGCASGPSTTPKPQEPK